MAPVLKIEKGASIREPRIFAYDFDAAGFSTHPAPVFLLNVGQIEFIDFLDPISFAFADGAIIPQGIFEQIERQPSRFGAKTDVTVHKASMLERERQIFNLLRDGKWVCFLAGEITDEVASLLISSRFQAISILPCAILVYRLPPWPRARLSTEFN
jgi:hypothetical protein